MPVRVKQLRFNLIDDLKKCSFYQAFVFDMSKTNGRFTKKEKENITKLLTRGKRDSV